MNISWINLILWGALGLYNLTCKKQIDKFDYGVMWIVLILNLIIRVVEKGR